MLLVVERAMVTATSGSGSDDGGEDVEGDVSASGGGSSSNVGGNGSNGKLRT